MKGEITILFYFISIVVFLLDQVTKMIVRVNIELNESVYSWGMHLTRIENSGLAGGFLQGYGRMFGILSTLVVLGIIYGRKVGLLSGRVTDIGLAFIVGGAVGNGIDRLLFGQVTDFIVRSNRAVLNIADHAIEIGVVLVVGAMLFAWVKEWRKKRK